jgi:AcrR family transcriptional regulator
MSSEEIRDSLFEAALSRFRAQGYDQTSVAELTRETGVAKGTFFNHFPTKEAILAEFVGRVWEEAAEASTREGHRGTDEIIHTLDGVMRRLETDPAVTREVALRLPSLSTPPALRSERDPGADLLSDFWSRWIRVRIDQSLPIAVPIEEITPEDLAALLVGAMIRTLAEGATGPHRSPPPSDPLPLALSMGRRAVFLLRSAGYVAPDPPTGTSH